MLFVLLRNVIVSTLFVSLWTWFARRWMAMSKHVTLTPVLGWHLVPMLIGADVFRQESLAYEEPVLRSNFGDDYICYAREVGRWIPRMSAPRTESVNSRCRALPCEETSLHSPSISLAT